MAQLISPEQAAALMKSEHAVLIDIRETEEYKRLRIPAAVLQPLSVLPCLPEDEDTDKPAIYFCHAGKRTMAHKDALEARKHAQTYLLEGGITAWEGAGLPVEKESCPMPIMRQVQVAAGSLVLVFVILGSYFPFFYLLTGFVGAGLVFGGVSGVCGMARLLARMPWNRKA